MITVVQVLLQSFLQDVLLNGGCERLNAPTLLLTVLAQHIQQTSTVDIDVCGYWVVLGGCSRIDYAVLSKPFLLFRLLPEEVAVGLDIVDGGFDSLVKLCLQLVNCRAMHTQYL